MVLDFLEALRFEIEFSNSRDGRSFLVAEGLATYVEYGGEIFGRKILAQLAQHVHKHVDRGRGEARARRHGALARHGVIGPEDERHRVNQKNTVFDAGGRLNDGDRRGLGWGLRGLQR